MHQYGGGEPVVAQGDVTAQMFVIERGKVAVERDGRAVATLGVGEFFGEMALSEASSGRRRCGRASRRR